MVTATPRRREGRIDVTGWLLAVACGAGVGLALGLTGGGGSIFAVPLLIYVLHQSPAAAVPVSLAAVALTALFGAFFFARQRLPVWPAAAAFAVGGVVGAPAGIWASRAADEAFLVLGFAVLALGVGGGFLIVPALAAVTRMGIHRAVATSLVALAAIGLAGAAGAVLHGALAWGVLAPFVAGGAAGMAGGRALAARIAGPALQRVFATAIVGVAVFMAADQLMS
jgi:hypothetical protein